MRIISIIPSFGSGGLTAAVLNRSNLLSSSRSDVWIFTYEFSVNYRDIVKSLRVDEKLHRKVRTINPYDYFFEKYDEVNRELSEHARLGAYRIETQHTHEDLVRVGFDSEGDRLWRSFTHAGSQHEYRIEFMDRFGCIVQIDHLDPEGFRRQSDILYDNIIICTKMYAKNGFCFLRNEIDENGRIIGVRAFSPNSKNVKFFKNIWDWRRQFFKEFLTSVDNAFILCDGNNVPGQFLRLKSERIRMVSVIHMNHLDDKGNLKRQYASYFDNLSKFDAVISLTFEQANDLRKLAGGRANIVVIGNPLPARSKQNVQRSRDAVVVSRLVGGKGLTEAVRAAKLVVERFPDFSMDIFGSGPLEPKLQSLISDLDLSENVRLMGQTKTPLYEFASSKISLFTSRSEGFGLTIAESLMMRTPVVSLPCSYGPRELIQTGRTGNVLPKRDLKLFAEAICDLLQDPVKQREFGDNGAMWINDNFGPESILKKWSSLFDDLKFVSDGH